MFIEIDKIIKTSWELHYNSNKKIDYIYNNSRRPLPFLGNFFSGNITLLKACRC